jgi:hypothetical protein
MNKNIARYPKVETINEYTDLDGNRGEKVTYITCPNCDSDIDIENNPETCICGQKICWDEE